MEPLLTVQTGAPGLISRANKGDSGGNTLPFRDLLWGALHNVDSLQKEAAKKASEVVRGEASSFHEVVLATEKATLALQLLVQVQNKAIEAYHEVMRLQL